MSKKTGPYICRLLLVEKSNKNVDAESSTADYDKSEGGSANSAVEEECILKGRDVESPQDAKAARPENTELFIVISVVMFVISALFAALFIDFSSGEEADSGTADNVLSTTVDLSVADAGDSVLFGSYEQDNNTANGKEPIEWLVLNKSDGYLLLLSKYALDGQPYHEEAFTDSEKALIPAVIVSNPENPDYGTTGGNDTQDQVFLLSIEALQYYFPDAKDRRISPTEYAGSRVSATGKAITSCWWWLRSPGDSSNGAAYVNDDGDIRAWGYDVDDDMIAVRPALFIHPES